AHTKEATRMFPNHLIRLTQAAMLAAVVAVFVPNLAQGKSITRPIPDAFERYAAAHPYGQGVIDTSQAPDVFDRYVKSHSQGSTVVLDGRSPDTRDAAYTAQLQVIDGRSPDTMDAAQNAQSTQLQVLDGRSPDTLDAAQNGQNGQLQVLDGRSPDTLDAAQTVQPIEFTSSSGFSWSDAGIGAASGARLILLLGVSMFLVLWTHRRHDVQAT